MNVTGLLQDLEWSPVLIIRLSAARTLDSGLRSWAVGRWHVVARTLDPSTEKFESLTCIYIQTALSPLVQMTSANAPASAAGEYDISASTSRQNLSSTLQKEASSIILVRFRFLSLTCSTSDQTLNVRHRNSLIYRRFYTGIQDPCALVVRAPTDASLPNITRNIIHPP